MVRKLTSTKIRNVQRRWKQGRITWEKLQDLMKRYLIEAAAERDSAAQNEQNV